MCLSFAPFRFKLLSQEEGEYFNVPVPPEGSEGNEELRQKFEVRCLSFGISGNRLSLPLYCFSCSWCGFYQALSWPCAFAMLLCFPENSCLSFKTPVKCPLPCKVILPPCPHSDLDFSLRVFIHYPGHFAGGLDRDVSNGEWKQWTG